MEADEATSPRTAWHVPYRTLNVWAPLVILAVVLIVIPARNGHSPLLYFTVEINAALLTLFLGTFLAQMRDSKAYGPSGFRYDQAIAITVILMGFAALNFLRGDNISVLFPGSFQLAAQSRSAHVVGMFAAMLIGVVSSGLLQWLNHSIASGQTKWECVHRVLSFVAVGTAIAAFLLYMGSFSIPLQKQTNWQTFIYLLPIALVGQLLTNVYMTVEISFPPLPKPLPGRMVTMGSRLAFPIGLAHYPFEMEWLHTGGTKFSTPWVQSTGLRSPNRFSTTNKSDREATFTLYQGLRSLPGLNRQLLQLHVPLPDGFDGAGLKARTRIDLDGVVHVEIFSDVRAAGEKILITETVEPLRSLSSPLQNLFAIIWISALFVFWQGFDKRRKSRLTEDLEWLQMAVGALEFWLSVVGEQVSASARSEVTQLVNEARDTLSDLSFSPRKILRDMKALKSKLTVLAAIHQIELALAENGS